MTISFQCSDCGRALKVADELAGRKAKCPQCKAVLFIPEGPTAAISTKPVKKRAAPVLPPVEEPEEAPDEEQADAGEEAAPPRDKKKSRGKKAKKSLLLPLLLAGGGVLILLCGGGAALALWYFWPSAQEDAYFFPDGTQLVAQVQMDAFLNSGAVQQARQAFPEFNQKVLTAFGGPSGATTASNLGPGYLAFQAATSNGSPPNFIAIQRYTQTVSAADVEAGIKRENPNATFTETKVGRFTVYDYQAANANGVGTQAMSFLMADSRRQVGGPAALLRTILQRDKKVELPDKLQATIKQTDFTATIAVAATRDFLPKTGFLPAMPPAKPGAPAASSPLDKMDSWSLTAKVGNDVDLSVTAICQDAAAANEVRDAAKKGLDQLKGLLTLAALAGKAPAGIGDLLDINMQVTGANVTVNKTLQVAPLIQMVKDQQPKAPPIVFPRPGK